MTNKCSCVECGKEFSIKGIHTHYERTHGADEVRNKYSSGNNGKYHLFTERAADKSGAEKLKYDSSRNTCKFCNDELPFEKRVNKFCGASCSASYYNKKREESGWSLSLDAKERISSSNTGRDNRTEKTLVCGCCGITFNRLCGTPRNLTKIKCDKCIHIPKPKKLIRRDLTKLNEYRQACKFKFGLGSFPGEFDVSLITQHGWYKAKNHGDNMRGVSRDHMVSVRYGFDNNIDPNVIAHPANCQLMQHHKNIGKYTNNSITYEELLERIRAWNLKYS